VKHPDLQHTIKQTRYVKKEVHMKCCLISLA